MNWVDTGFAFLEGLALIASPCILPVLPLILATSIEGGKARPYGIIAGFVIAFSAFAYAARYVIDATGVDLDWVRTVSLVLLTAFALVLLVPRLSEAFSRLTAPIAGWGSARGRGRRRGFLGGMLIGLPIGFVWTPCAGPILAAVLVQVSTQNTNTQSFLVLLGFAIGAATPMLLIALTGRRFLTRFSVLERHGEHIKRGMGVVLLLAVAFIASGIDPQRFFDRPPERSMKEVQGLVNARPPYPAPEFAGIERWFNSKPLTMKGLKGKVVLVDFWTYSCVNCVRTLPHLVALDEKYRKEGLVMVGVHSPEFAFERKASNVQKAIERFGITYPVALDGTLRTWVNFENRFWPAQYLIDQKGQVIYTHFGEGDEDILENNVRVLLGIREKAAIAEAPPPAFDREQTPETYLGYTRSETYGGKMHRTRDGDGDYAFPNFLPINYYALQGRWKVGGESIVSREAGAALRLNFRAGKVFLVLGSTTGRPVKASISLNGAPLIPEMEGGDASGGVVTVNQHRLYELIDQKDPKNRLLEITAQEPGLEAYAFTFGS